MYTEMALKLSAESSDQNSETHTDGDEGISDGKLMSTLKDAIAQPHDANEKASC
jgi:hypothetical protein